MASFNKATNKCKICKKSVYPMDAQINLDGSLFHKPCAKCQDCNCQITISNFCKNESGDETVLLCKTHYFKRFHEGGSYLGAEKYEKKQTREMNPSGAATNPITSTVSPKPGAAAPTAAAAATPVPATTSAPTSTEPTSTVTTDDVASVAEKVEEVTLSKESAGEPTPIAKDTAEPTAELDDAQPATTTEEEASGTPTVADAAAAAPTEKVPEEESAATEAAAM